MLRWDPLSDWDRRIMERLPLVADLARFSDFDAALRWIVENIDRDDYTYKSYRFFFRKQEDWVLFTMRWG